MPTAFEVSASPGSVAERDTHQERVTRVVYTSDFSHHMQESVHRIRVRCISNKHTCITTNTDSSPLQTTNIIISVLSAPWSNTQRQCPWKPVADLHCLVTGRHCQAGWPTAGPRAPQPCPAPAAFLPAAPSGTPRAPKSGQGTATSHLPSRQTQHPVGLGSSRHLCSPAATAHGSHPGASSCPRSCSPAWRP